MAWPLFVRLRQYANAGVWPAINIRSNVIQAFIHHIIADVVVAGLVATGHCRWFAAVLLLAIAVVHQTKPLFKSIENIFQLK